jgi:hypothetical protein
MKIVLDRMGGYLFILAWCRTSSTVMGCSCSVVHWNSTVEFVFVVGRAKNVSHEQREQGITPLDEQKSQNLSPGSLSNCSLGWEVVVLEALVMMAQSVFIIGFF